MDNHLSNEIARLFYQQIKTLLNKEKSESNNDGVSKIFKGINQIFVLATEEEKLRFAGLGTRIAFAGHKYDIPSQHLFYVYAFRKNYLRHQFNPNHHIDIDELFKMGLMALSHAVMGATGIRIPKDIYAQLAGNDVFKTDEIKVESFRPFVRVLLIKDEADKKRLTAIDEENPTENIFIHYNTTGKNDFFNPSIHLMRKIFGFPLSVNLLDVEVDENGIYHPKGFTILPDYMVDITSISECFKHDKTDPKLYLLKKFIPVTSNKYLAIGNIANYFLDELLSDGEKGFKELFGNIFSQNPIGFSTMNDQEIREIYQISRRHYHHLIDTIKNDFPEQNINIENIYLEPSFYSRNHGIQGRLDLWNRQEDGKASIVELKSGSPFMPNKQGLSINHYIQTLLYDLLVKSVYGKQINPTNFILYSKVENSRLRFAQVSKTHQFEAMQLRNHLVAIEYMMTQMNAETELPINMIFSQNCRNWKGFHLRDLDVFNKAYQQLDEIGKKYFHTLIGFVAREHFTAKLGASKSGNISGQANLWCKTLQEKQDDFEIMSHLEIEFLPEGNNEPIFIFKKTESTNPLANFRRGDICVLYPFVHQQSNVLSHQIFKCTIIELQQNTLKVRLRAKQHNNKIFNENQFWNLEHDLYDSSYNNLYKQLLGFASFDKQKRDLILTKAAPTPPENPKQIAPPSSMTQEQQNIFERLVHQGNLFLLWGPPGTGKTNMMLKHLVGHVWKNTPENILLLTYTNRAADEICQAIESYQGDIREHYFRIGSKYSTSKSYKGRLLNELIKESANRKEVKQIIQQHRIVIATVASMMGKKELFQLKKFDRLIIDEASQITEPMLCGLLPLFPKVLMIGDHKQLPAVTIQSADDCKVHDPELNQIGITDLRTSLFERLYLRYQEEGYDYALARLSHQGRMHQEIMEFPNQQFYENQLSILPEEIPYRKNQILELSGKEHKYTSERVLFIPVTEENTTVHDKTNPAEAKKVLEVVQAFQKAYGNELNISDIGIITPFRAQIACIRNTLMEGGIYSNNLTIDTVERYQGGARKIIIISVCANHLLQLDTIVSSKGKSTVDRKLNVAITRAKEHLIMIGNPEILKHDPNYSTFISKYALI